MATASPPETSVSLSATLDYNGNPIIVNTGDLAKLKKGQFQFSLSQPLVLGTVHDFLSWLHTQWGLPDLNTDIVSIGDAIQGKPIIGNLYSGFEDFVNDGTITITQLTINTTTTTPQYQISVTLTLSPPINLFGPINFDGIGVSVSNMSS
ncbi:MAG: hypothetical protein ACREF4_16980 [Gammaproteobacteria bacterium]